jgi:hypothetical protein
MNTDIPRFDTSHTFCLAGHSHDTGGERYVLKPHEFYANATTCNRVTIGASLSYDFVNHMPDIKVPQPDTQYSDVLYYSGSPFLERKTAIAYYNAAGKKQRKNIITVTKPYKVYAPFSTKSATNTIPPFMYHYINMQVCKLNASVKKDTKFTYKAFSSTEHPKEMIYARGDKYNLYYVGISGILTPNTSIMSEFTERWNTLKDVSREIQSIFNIPDSYTEHYLVVPVYANDSTPIKHMPPYPDIEYVLDVFDVITSLSILGWREVATMLHIHKPSIMNILDDLMLDTNQTYDIIRAYTKDDGPSLLVNPLCRGFETNVRYNSNDNSNILGMPQYRIQRTTGKHVEKNGGRRNTRKQREHRQKN